jgi:hypothetical protein
MLYLLRITKMLIYVVRILKMYASFLCIGKICFFLRIEKLCFIHACRKSILRITESMLLAIRIVYMLPLLRITKSMMYFVRNIKYVCFFYV